MTMIDLPSLALGVLAGLTVAGLAAWLHSRARRQEFLLLATQMQQQNNQSFLDLATQRLHQTTDAQTAALDQRMARFDALMRPMQDQVKALQDQVQKVEISREGAYQQLLQAIANSNQTQAQLRAETGLLLQALRSPNARGSWGEMQVQRILELTGMAMRTQDFTQQQSLDGGAARPDFVVALPGNKYLVIDAKVPGTAYTKAIEAKDDDARALAFKQHAQHVRGHIRALGGRAYWERIDHTPDFVVMFMPGEHLLSTALDQENDLIEYAISQRVVLATPTTLIALLRAVAHGWQQENVAENARAIAALGRELHDSIRVHAQHWASVGKSLGKAVDSFNDAIGSLQTRVITRAQKFATLGVNIGDTIPDLTPIDDAARSLNHPALTSPNEDAQKGQNAA